MPTRERVLKERRQQLINLLVTAYRFPQYDAEYIGDKALEKAQLGEEFRTQVNMGLLCGELVADITLSVWLVGSLKGEDTTVQFSHQEGNA